MFETVQEKQEHILSNAQATDEELTFTQKLLQYNTFTKKKKKVIN